MLNPNPNCVDDVNKLFNKYSFNDVILALASIKNRHYVECDNEDMATVLLGQYEDLLSLADMWHEMEQE